VTSPRDEDMLTVDGWPGGVNNRARETENVNLDNRLKIPVGEFLSSAVNVDLTRKGKVLRRRGYASVEAGYTHSLWRVGDAPFALMVRDGQLCKITAPEPLIVELQAVELSRPMSYTTVNDRVYFSNGLDKGYVDFDGAVHPWGMVIPAPPALTLSGGLGLNAGRYQVAVTYTGADGEEGGSSEVAVATVVQGGGITATMTAAPADAMLRSVYVTQANSEVFTLYSTLPVATLTLNIGQAGMGAGRVLETQHLEPVIAGDIVRYYNGRIYFAVDNAVFFTEALRYGLVRYSQALYMMPKPVTLLEPSEDGIYVGYGDTVVFLGGSNPYEVSNSRVNSRGPVVGTGTRVPGYFLERELEHVPVWWTQQGGMVAGYPGGETKQLTQDRLAVPSFGAGAILAREREGMRHLVSTLRQPGDNSFGASDSVVAEIRRNAVTT